MKTEQVIREEIELTERTMKNHRIAYELGKIPKDVFDTVLVECWATMSTLLWVLGENDRYD